ncbi:MAG: hypothetical protein IJS39_06420 [Synergistaceae bacterium]|nr:hypothetical protein [Synergistaceae bacterium]
MSEKEWTTGAKVWFWFVIIINIGAAAYYFYQACSLAKGLSIPSYTPQVLWGLTLMFVLAPGLPLAYSALHVWLMRSKKKAALYTIIAWFVLVSLIDLYMGGTKPFAGLVGLMITYSVSRKVVG